MALYRYVARKVSRAKWQPPEEWAGKHATADGVTACLKTGSNRLSLWRFADPADSQTHRRLATFVVALVDRRRLRQRIERRVASIQDLSVGMQAHAAARPACRQAVGD